jgi:hypothetical protein
MAEEALKKAGYSVKAGTVFDEKQDCVGCLKDGVFTTQPIYEKTRGFNFDETDASCTRLIEDIANKLGLVVEEHQWLLSVKTDKPEQMPTAVIAYKQLKTAPGVIRKNSLLFSISAQSYFSNKLRDFREKYEKSILESVKAEEKRK